MSKTEVGVGCEQGGLEGGGLKERRGAIAPGRGLG